MEKYWIIIIPASIGAIVSIAGILLNNFLNLINKKKIENYINYQKERINSYNEFHKQIISALGYLPSTYKYGSQPDFNEFNKKDIKTYLEKKGLLSGKIEEYTQNWENEKTENIYKISSYIHQTEPYMVENEINKARNIYISNIFYFSKY